MQILWQVCYTMIVCQLLVVQQLHPRGLTMSWLVFFRWVYSRAHGEQSWPPWCHEALCRTWQGPGLRAMKEDPQFMVGHEIRGDTSDYYRLWE